VHAHGQRNDGDVLAGPHDLGGPERDRRRAFGDVRFRAFSRDIEGYRGPALPAEELEPLAREELVFEENGRFPQGQGREHQPIGIGGV
jgi:hypothetical protein